MERDLQPLRRLLPQPFEGYTPDAPVWGWDASLVHSLQKAGYTNLPSNEQLADIRTLSSRRTAVEVLKQLRRNLRGLPLVGESAFITSPEAFSDAFPLPPIQPAKGNDNLLVSSSPITGEKAAPLPSPTHIIKEPYSSSGRGLRPVCTFITPKTRQWALRCIREQGGVEVEPYYNKVMDFAMEFTCHKSGVCYDGLSVFLTRGNNTYTGNIVAPQDFLEDRICAYINRDVLASVRDSLIETLSNVLTNRYLGPIGVDMMVVKQDDRYMLHPCVEINLRRTMGNLALYMLPLLPDGQKATFSILFHKDPQALCSQIRELQSTQTVILLTPAPLSAEKDDFSAPPPDFFQTTTVPAPPTANFAALLTIHS